MSSQKQSRRCRREIERLEVENAALKAEITRLTVQHTGEQKPASTNPGKTLDLKPDREEVWIQGHRDGYEAGIDQAIKYIGNNLWPYVESAFDLLDVLSGIIVATLELSSYQRNVEAVREEISILSTELAAAYDRYTQMRIRTGYRGDFSDVNRFIKPCYNAAHAFASDKTDDGSVLLQVVKQTSGRGALRLLEHFENIDVGGRPKGMADWNFLLAEKWIEHMERTGDTEPYTIKAALQKKLEAKERLTRLEMRQLKKLREATDDSEMARKLKTAYLADPRARKNWPEKNPFFPPKS